MQKLSCRPYLRTCIAGLLSKPLFHMEEIETSLRVMQNIKKLDMLRTNFVTKQEARIRKIALIILCLCIVLDDMFAFLFLFAGSLVLFL